MTKKGHSSFNCLASLKQSTEDSIAQKRLNTFTPINPNCEKGELINVKKGFPQL